MRPHACAFLAQIVALMLTTLGAVWPSPPTLASGAVVGTGIAASCTETALKAALSGGGPVIFNCGATPVTIFMTAPATISADASIDGGDLIILTLM